MPEIPTILPLDDPAAEGAPADPDSEVLELAPLPPSDDAIDPEDVISTQELTLPRAPAVDPTVTTLANLGSWRALCDTLSQWHDDDLAPLIEPLDGALEGHHADAERVASAWWLGRLFHDDVEPRLRIARRVIVHSLWGREQAHRFAKHLADTPQLAHITHLELIGNHMDDAGLVALGQATAMHHLATLNLAQNALGHTPDGLAALADGPHARTLNVLTLRHNHIDADALRALFKGQPFAQLTHLDLAHNPLGDAALDMLAALGPDALPALESLRLDACDLCNPAPLFTHLPALRRVSLAHNAITRDAIDALVQHAERLPHLEHVDLSHNRIGYGGVRALLHCDALPDTVTLTLNDNRVSMLGGLFLRLMRSSRMTVHL